MTLTEYINTMSFGIIYGLSGNAVECTQMSMEKAYEKNFFILPRVFCKDGFSISIQIDNGHYCGSENGIRKFGIDWKLVEWGYPSQPIDGEKYMSENTETTSSVGGYVPVELMEELIEGHGGIDLQTTLQKKMECLETA